MTIVVAIENIDIVKSHVAEIVGSENVSSDPIVLCSYAEDASPFEGKAPAIVARAETTQEIQEIVKYASENGIVIVPVGGRSSICGSPIPRVDNALMIDLTRMDNILAIDTDTMTVTVQVGITWSRLIHELKENGFKIGFRGPYGGNAGTVGGSLSANSIGCGASAHGGACDSVVSLEIVLANGDVIHTGSRWKECSSEIKTAFARYCTFNDITGIFLGDQGTLGIKTAATLKMFPLAKSIAYFDMGFSDLVSGVEAFHEIQKEHLAEEIVMLGDTNSIELLASSYRSIFPDLSCVFGVIIEEADEQIATIKKRLCENIARSHGGTSIGTFLSKAHWLNMFNLVQSLFEEGFWYNTCHLRPISTIPALIEKFHEIAEKYDLRGNDINWIVSALGVDHCFASGWITLFLKNKTSSSVLESAWDELKKYEMESGGVPYWTGKLWEPYVIPLVEQPFLDLMRKIKSIIDPKNILHPQSFLD